MASWCWSSKAAWLPIHLHALTALNVFLPHRRTGYLVALVLSDAQEVWITFNRGRYQQTSRVNCRALMSLRRYRQVSVKAGMANGGIRPC